jgi:ATP-dependent DNA ligase
MGSKREGVMLAYPVDEKKISRLPDNVFFQRKLNGERARVTWDNSSPRIISSCGNEMPFLKHIKDALVQYGFEGIQLDGELYCHGMSREEIHSTVSRRVSSKNKAQEERIEFHVFDIVMEETVQFRRFNLLDVYFSNSINMLPLVQVKTFYDNKEKILHYASQFIDEGYEGVIVRNPDAYYTPRKCNFMLKFKPTSEDTYRIVGFEEEVSIHGEPKDTLGAVIVIDDDGKVFSVGTGKALTKESRQYWWNLRDTLKGMFATVKHSEILTINGFPTCCSLLTIDINKDNKDA